MAKSSTIEKYQTVDQPKIGELYHLSWANSGCVWRLKKFNGNGTCIMVTPKSRREITAKIVDLRHTRKNQKS